MSNLAGALTYLIFYGAAKVIFKEFGDNNGSYCGYRNSASGATAALVLGNGGAAQNSEFEGTLVKGDQVSGYGQFKVRLYAGYTSQSNRNTGY